MTDPTMREVKTLMTQAKAQLVRQDTASDRRALDDLMLAMQLLIGLVENHRHRMNHYHPIDQYFTTGPMQAMEGK